MTHIWKYDTYKDQKRHVFGDTYHDETKTPKPKPLPRGP